MPVRFVVQQLLRAPVEQVFAVISDPSRRTQWQSSLRSVELVDPGAPTLGTRWRETTHLGTRFELEITRFEPFTGWAERGIGALANAELVVHFAHVESLDGEPSTRVTVETTIQFKGLARLAAPAVRWAMPGAIRRDLGRAADIAVSNG